MKDASQYDGRSKWKSASPGAFQVARREGWLDQCCSHMRQRVKPKGYWTLELCMEESAKYSTRAEWNIRSNGSYTRALRNGWLDQCCEHMERVGGSDNNVVYVWRDRLTDLHKIGITSERLGEFRIGGLNKNVEPAIVFMLKVPDARAVESELLKLGTDPGLDSSVDGYTEFRRLTDAELGKAVSIAYEAALAA